jgi:hypothetical protein
MWDYSGWANYHALQTSISRRFENGIQFSAFYVFSKTLTTNSTDGAGAGGGGNDTTSGLPASNKDLIRQYDYSLADYDRPHNFVFNFIYQTPRVASGVLGYLVNDWQLSGIYRYSSGRPYKVGFSIPGHRQREPDRQRRQPGRAHRAHLRSGQRLQRRSVQAARHECFAPPQPAASVSSPAASSCTPATNNLDLSLVEDDPDRQDGPHGGPPRRLQRAQPHPVHGRQRDRQLPQPDGSDDHQPALRLGREPGERQRLRLDQRRGQPRRFQLVTRLTF